MQRAEYYEDRLAADIAGTSASVTAMEKFNYEPTFYLVLERVAQFRYTRDLFDEFRHMIQHVPKQERMRLDRIMQTDSARLDATHPPTRFRVDYLVHNHNPTPTLQLDHFTIDELEAEFVKVEQLMQRGMLDDYRSWFLS